LLTTDCGLHLEVEPGFVRMAGEIDIANSDELAAGLDSAVIHGRPLLVDLSNVGFIDVTGTRLLVEAARRCRPAAVCVLGGPGSLAVILEVGGWAGEITLLDGDGTLPR
jgi:anti-anti-sigma factor